MAGVYDFSAKAIDGRERSLSEFQGQVLLIVNVASACGFTPQYEGLQALYERFHDRGFSVLGFPCNQFGAQESGDEATICSFAEGRFGVTFPMFAKVEVNGPNAHPLWTYLQSAKPGLLGSKAIKWNFTKFLIDRHGHVVGRYAPSKTPAALAADVERRL
jgi:glutathione peroxidase